MADGQPSSTLGQQWPYYIQPAEQTPEVQAQLDALIHTRIAEDGDTLNPETITCLDPACGGGRIWSSPTTCLRPSTWSAATGCATYRA